MSFLELFALDTVKDAVTWLGFRQWKNYQEDKKALRQWNVRKPVPFVGWLIARKAKKPKQMMSNSSKKKLHLFLSGFRRFVQTSTFEDMVYLLLPVLRSYRKKLTSKSVSTRWPKESYL